MWQLPPDRCLSAGSPRLLRVVVDLPKILELRARGSKTWVRAVGRSMIPLYFSGEELLVERCDEGALLPGDVAVMAGARSELIAHVVASVNPLVTASYLGQRDRGRLHVLGRVVAFRRFGRQLAVPRPAVLAAHRVLSLPSVHRVARALLSAAVRTSRPLRRLLLRDVLVRRVDVDERERAVERAAGILGGAVVGSIQSAQQVYAAVAGDRWLGVGWRANGAVIVAVPAWARHLGVEALLERALS